MLTKPLTILIDGLCPLCRREGAMMMRMDKGRGRLALVDIAAPGFDPGVYGRSMDEVMGSIHAVLPDGRVIAGMGVFRAAYAVLGWGWLLAPTGWPLLRPLFDRFYAWFARNRMKFTFRSAEAACEGGRCKIDSRPATDTKADLNRPSGV